MSRRTAAYRRLPARFAPQPRVLVLCEDSKSACTYLREAAVYFRCLADVEVAHIGRTDPKGIVEAAKLALKKYDVVYCAIDRDEHKSFDEAIELSRQPPVVHIVDSHPCYEFWLLLHLRLTRKPFRAAGKKSPAECVVSELRDNDPFRRYTKGAVEGLFSELLPRLPDARRRAAQVLAEAVADGEPNPSTRLHLLVDEFERLGQPQLV